ncbi:MAG: PEP-CTERM sorting domain-containing protein, partial [Gemmataceae bacterium]|nr:PEP-CTERM sorting domain-containing protein [Gemmataceae bacterium]
AAFDDGTATLTTSGSTTTARAFLFMDSGTAAVTAPTSGADANRILLATFTFTGVTPGQSSTIAVDPSAGADNVLASGINLDPFITAGQTATINVTAIPEPGTFALAGLVLAGAGAARRFRRAAN